MSAAIAALLAGLAVVYALGVTPTPPSTEPVVTYLDALTSFLTQSPPRALSSDEALIALTYTVVIYVVVFSAAFFLLRALAVLAAVFGLPDEAQIRLNREVRRGRGARHEMLRRGARYTAIYNVRARAAAARRAREAQAAMQRAVSSDPTLADFDL